MIFVDTSYWIAAAMRRDANHEAARVLWERLADERLVTSNHVLGETWTFVRSREGHRGAVALLDRILSSPRLTMEHVPADLESEAWAWLRARDERPYSFVDATSFALMRSLRIREALAFDDGFAAAGFTLARP